MKRYKSGILGMKVYDNGDWVQYPIFELLQEKCLANDDLAKDRLDMIQARNTEIIRMKKESEESHIKYQKIIDRINNEYISLEGFANGKDNTIYILEANNKKLQLQSKCADLKHDIFIFSVVLNIVFTVFTTINAFGGIL